jgi:hypothetical protein
MSKKKHSKKEEPEELITAGMKQHLKYIVELSILTKICILLFVIFILHGMPDIFAMHYYYDNAVSIFAGDAPYINHYYEYPILIFIPVTIALIPSLLLNSIPMFMIVFSILMIICDCISAICVYLVARKVWGDSKKAVISAFIYVTAFSTAYFAMIDISPFAVCLMMVGFTLLFYGKEIFGFSRLTDYSALVLGYFTKIFPIVALPFIVLHKSRTTSLKEEIISALKIIIPISVILFLPTFILNPLLTLRTYIPIRLDVGYFPNTIIWTLYVWLHDVFNMAVTMDNVLVFMYVCMIASLGLLGYAALKYQKQSPSILLKFVLWATVIVVLSVKARSPGYILFFTPLICILASDSIYKIGLFYVTQLLGFIEFPLGFWTLWTNIEYTNPMYSSNWYMALLLFTFEFSLLLLLVWVVTEPIKIYREILNN